MRVRQRRADRDWGDRGGVMKDLDRLLLGVGGELTGKSVAVRGVEKK